MKDPLRRAEYDAIYGAIAHGAAEVVKPDGGTIAGAFYPKSAQLSATQAAVAIALALCSIFAFVDTGWLLNKHGASVLAIALAVAWLTLALIAYPLARSTRWFSWLVAAAAICVGLRLFVLYVTGGSNQTGSDPWFYEDLARRLAEGSGLLVEKPGLPSFKALYPPLYPMLLAGSLVVTDGSRYAPALINFIIDASAAFMIFRIAGTFAAPRMGATGAYIYMIWPSMVMASAVPNKEGLVCLLFLLAIYAIFQLRKGRGGGVLLGVSTGLLALTQPALCTLPPLFSLVLVRPMGLIGYVKAMSVAAMTGVAVLFPWWLRNYLVLDAFVPLTSAFGLNSYVATFHTWNMPEQIRGMNELQLSSFLGAFTWDWIVDNPITFILGRLRQAAISLGLDHAYIEVFQRLSAPAALEPTAFALVLQLPWLALWLVALRCAANRATGLLHQLVFLCFAHIALVNVWLEFGQRHRIVLLPLLLALIISCLKPGALHFAKKVLDT